MTQKTLYLCPQKLQAKLLIGWWTVGDLCITLVLLLAFFLTGYAPFFLALCLGYLFLSLRFDGKSNLLGGLKRHMLYHTTHQLFVKTAKEQNKPHKKALPIQRVIDFKLEDNYVISDGHYVYFYRYYAPNTHIMTDDEIQSEIGKLGRLFDTLKCSFSLFATDKVENLEAIKNYYLSLPVRYEYINSEIVESIERSDVESSAVQRAYYIIYRTDSPQEDIYSTLSGHGLHVERATKAETAVLLRNYFVREFLNCDIYTIAEEVSNIPNIKKAKQVVFDREILSRLTPHNIHFSASYAEQGNCYRKTLMIKNFPKDIPPAALMELAKQRGTTFTMRLTPMNRSIARRLINNQMRQQNVRRGKGMVTERIEADQDAAIIRDFYADINRNHNSIYHVNVFVEIYGSTRNELAEMEKEVIDILAGVSTTSEHLHLEQREAFSSVQPLGTDHFLADANNMPSLTAAALFPFSSSSCLDTHGMVLGNTEDGGPFIYDLLKRTETLTNSNYFTGGVAGMGKSFLNKKIIKFLRMFGVKVYIFDPEGEYGDLVHQMGGTVINRASGKWKNNIFQVRRFKSADEDDRIGLEYGGETPVYYQHLSWLQEQLSIIHSGLSADNLRALMVMVQDMYKEFGIDADTDFSKLMPLDYPTYTDLYTFIEKHSQKEYKMLTSETMKQLLLHLKSCYDGALSPLFNGHTNIINSDFICFNMKDLLSGSEERSNAVLNNDFAWAWQVMMQKDGYTCICLDEMHLFLRNPYMRKLLQSSVYRARKYNGMIGCCTQRVLQCLNSEYDEEVSAILDMSPTKFLFHPGPVDHDVIKDKLKLTDGESNYISNSHKGHYLVMAGHERYAVHIGKMPHEDALFGSGGGR